MSHVWAKDKKSITIKIFGASDSHTLKGGYDFSANIVILYTGDIFHAFQWQLIFYQHQSHTKLTSSYWGVGGGGEGKRCSCAGNHSSRMFAQFGWLQFVCRLPIAHNNSLAPWHQKTAMDGIAHCGQLKRTKRVLTVQVMERKEVQIIKWVVPLCRMCTTTSRLHQHGESNCIANHTNLHVQ